MGGLLVAREKEGRVLRVTLNRPEKRNALSLGLLGELEAAVSEIAGDAEARVVVLAANGPAFCAGHDLSEMVGRSEGDYRDLFESCTRVMLGLRRLPQPVIARVHGLATAAGCGLVADATSPSRPSRHRRDARGQDRPVLHDSDGPPRPRRAGQGGHGNAPDRRLAGFRGERAEFGLVNRVAPDDRLDATLDELVDAVLASSRLVVGLGKTTFYTLADMSEEAAYRGAVPIMTDNALRADAQRASARSFRSVGQSGRSDSPSGDTRNER